MHDYGYVCDHDAMNTNTSTSTSTTAMQGLHITGLCKHYASGDNQRHTVLDGINLHVAPGEFVAITGASGVGKSTLLNCMAALDDWDSGDISLNGQALSSLNAAQRAAWRAQHVGFVFQAFHVLPHLDVAQNVGLPLMLNGIGTQQRHDLVAKALTATGLGELGSRLPQQLSGGQLQRVAIARAVVHAPALLLADEPTGNLDPEMGERIMDLLIATAQHTGASLVLVTHSTTAASRAQRQLRLSAQGLHPA